MWIFSASCPGLASLLPAWIGWDNAGIIIPLHVVALILIATECLKHPRNGTSVLLWIFIAWSLPIIGPILYLAFGVDRVRIKGAKKAASDALMLAERRNIEKSTDTVTWCEVYNAASTAITEGSGEEIERAMNAVVPEHPILGGNCVDLLVNGDEAFEGMFNAINHARHHIHLQTYILARDTTGRHLMNLLAKATARGVKVRVIADRVGSNRAFVSGFFRRYRKQGLAIKAWHQANPLKRQFQLNLRNHRKILVIDGRMAFTGGINFHEENLTELGRPGIRDYHFQIEGPFVQELQYTFLRDWCFVANEPAQALLTPDYFPINTPTGDVAIRLVNSGPTAERYALSDAFFLALASAKKSITLATPYFVPPPEIMKALRGAALRGVNVRIILPRKNNYPLVRYASHALYEQLLTSSVRIFERNPPFAHTKALLIDEETALIGSANLDIRSLHLNYETDVLIHGQAFTNRLNAELIAEIAASHEILLPKWQARPTRKRVLENLAYLLSPML